MGRLESGGNRRLHVFVTVCVCVCVCVFGTPGENRF